MGALDPVQLSEELIRCPSITPEEGGALDLLQARLEGLGFTCHRLLFSEDGTPDVDNLYARLGTAQPNFCFAGHTDVVPPGDVSDWASPPFSPVQRDGRLFGRGASDMKCAIAAMVTGTEQFLDAGGVRNGSISFLITGDEEGPSINGTRKVLDWMRDQGEVIDACLVGEPTNPDNLGDMVKIGRRGSLNCWVTVRGTQGHAAYPHLADNPIPKLMKILSAINDEPLDQGNAHFPATTVALTTIDVGNETTNVIPAQAKGRFNIRFNDMHTGASLSHLIEERFRAIDPDCDIEISISGESFLTPPGLLSDVISDSIEEVCGTRPELSTTGGTSDARFIKDHCPVAEFGMINQTAHKVDENAVVEDVRRLSTIYAGTLARFFARFDASLSNRPAAT